MKKLYRSQGDKKISGLCGGLATWLGIDATIVRLLTVVVALFSLGTAVVLYIIASIIVPKENYSGFTGGPDFY